MNATNYTIISVEPWDRRPIHPVVAKTRGLQVVNDIAHEDVVVITGYSTGGAIHHPIQFEGRLFRPFATHRARNHTEVTIVHENGTITKHENCIRVKRVKSPADGSWEPNAITLDTQNPNGIIVTTKIKDATSWSTTDTNQTPDGMIFFSVKAVEYTPQEVVDHNKIKARHEYQIPKGSKKPTLSR